MLKHKHQTLPRRSNPLTTTTTATTATSASNLKPSTPPEWTTKIIIGQQVDGTETGAERPGFLDNNSNGTSQPRTLDVQTTVDDSTKMISKTSAPKEIISLSQGDPKTTTKKKTAAYSSFSRRRNSMTRSKSTLSSARRPRCSSTIISCSHTSSSGAAANRPADDGIIFTTTTKDDSAICTRKPSTGERIGLTGERIGLTGERISLTGSERIGSFSKPSSSTITTLSSSTHSSLLLRNRGISSSTSSLSSGSVDGSESSGASSSSASSSNEMATTLLQNEPFNSYHLNEEWGVLRVQTDGIRSDTDYKTVYVSTKTTASELVRLLLGKFRLGLYKDPKLYYITMDIVTKQQGLEVVNVLGLEQDAKPLELDRCQPVNTPARFRLNCRPGIRVRVFDYSVDPQSNYKSILISTETTCAESVALVLQMHARFGLPDLDKFVLVSVDNESQYEYVLPAASFLAHAVLIQSQSKDKKTTSQLLSNTVEIHLRPYNRPFQTTQYSTVGPTHYL